MKNKETLPAEHTGYINGIAWLRIIMSLCVVASHVYLIGPRSAQFNSSLVFDSKVLLEDVFFFNFYCLAVPVFLLVSTYLFAAKIKNRGGGYLVSRLVYYMALTFFWTILYTVFFKITSIVAFLDHGWSLIYEFLFSANQTIYYFFGSLFIVTCVSYCLKNVSTRMLLFLFSLFVGVLSGLPIIVLKNNDLSFLLAWWSPINFLPYPVFSLLWVRQSCHICHSKIMQCLVFSVFVFVAWCEWKLITGALISFDYNGCVLPPYTRVSVVLGAIFIFTLFMQYVTFPIPKKMMFMSDYSLGLYCIHIFFVNFLENGFAKKRLVLFPVVVFASWVTVFVYRCMLGKLTEIRLRWI